MRYFVKIIITVAVTGTVMSCNRNSGALPVIDLDAISKSNYIDLKVSDFMEDIEVVDLETTSDNLFSSGSSSAYITATYIIIRNRDAFFQFDRKGKYIRKLAERGNGPREFTFIRYCFVDEETNILYFVDIRDKSAIRRIDLMSAQHLEPLYLDLKGFEIGCLKNNHIYGYPSTVNSSWGDDANPDTSVVAFQYNLQSESMKKYYGNHKYSILPVGNSMIAYGSHLSLFNMHYSDTLYRLQDEKILPSVIVKMNNKMTDYREGGDVITLLFEYDNGVIIIKSNYTYRKRSSDREDLQGSVDYYLHVSRAGKLKNIRQVLIDPIGITTQTKAMIQASAAAAAGSHAAHGTWDMIIDPFPKVRGIYGYLLIEQEEDNPKIIIGKMR